MYDGHDSSAYCCMWDETKGRRGGNEISSGILKWADMTIPDSGHTHQEADTVHASIERKRKKLPTITILTPWDWQKFIRQCSNKYNVVNMEVEDFKNFQNLYSSSGPFVQRKNNVDKEPFHISKSVQLRVTNDKFGFLLYKKSFEKNTFKMVDLRRNKRTEVHLPDSLQQTRQDLVPISLQKYKDIMELLYVPSYCHDFYKNLPHSTSGTDYPEDTTEDL